MEFKENRPNNRLRHSVLGIIAFVMPLVIIITGLALFMVHLPEFMETRLGYIDTFFERYNFILPLSFLSLLLGFLALKQPGTEKRMVKWGLVASAVPTIALMLEMGFHIFDKMF